MNNMLQLKIFQKKTRKLSKNDKFLTNKTKICLLSYGFIFFMKLRLNYQMIVFISHVTLSENLLNEAKK